MPQLTLAGLMLIPAAAVPVPETLTVCGLPLALSLMLSTAVLLPVAAGVKVTLTTVLLPGVIVIGTVPALSAKSVALAPVSARFEITKLPVPVLLIATGSGVLAV